MWEKKYNIKSNLEEKEKHNESKCEFGELYSNGEGNFQNVNIIEYKNDIEFVDDIKRINSEKISLYGVDVSRANKILMEYYPEKFKKRHLLSYPVGQFIYYLHNILNIIKGSHTKPWLPFLYKRADNCCPLPHIASQSNLL